MSRCLPVALAFAVAAILCGVAVPSAQREVPPFRDGQSFYVVAHRAHLDTARFRICGVDRSPVSPPDFPAPELWPDGDDRIADAAVKSRIEAAFARQNRFRIAPALDDAAYVFFAEATFVPSAVRAGAPTSVVALVVPARAFREAETSAATLLSKRVWEGAYVAPMAEEASPEDLVLQLHGTAPTVMAKPLLADARLNGRTICVAPEPQKAPEMRPEVGSASRTPDAGRHAASVAGVSPNRDAPTFQAGIVVVAVHVVVSNQQDAFVGGLSASDFAVFEDGIAQRIERMTAESERFTAALVIDTSYSMLPRLSEVKAAASAFIDMLRPEDRALAVTFDSRAWLMCDVTSDKDALRRAIVRLRPFGAATRLHDALDAVTKERLDRIAGRRAIVALTDGLDVASQRATASTVMADLEASNVTVYSVQFGSTGSGSRRREAPASHVTRPDGYFDTIVSFEHAREYLEQLSANTGGLFQPASSTDAIVRAFRRAAEDLRNQYVLYYYPSNSIPDGGLRHLRVEVHRPGVTVRARAAYRAPGTRRD